MPEQPFPPKAQHVSWPGRTGSGEESFRDKVAHAGGNRLTAYPGLFGHCVRKVTRMRLDGSEQSFVNGGRTLARHAGIVKLPQTIGK